jgi:hypothetical protein
MSDSTNPHDNDANGRTGPELRDLEVLRTDRDEARSIAAECRRELAAKGEELAALTVVFEKSRQHLIRLQLTVNQLREERHRFADADARAEA